MRSFGKLISHTILFIIVNMIFVGINFLIVSGFSLVFSMCHTSFSWIAAFFTLSILELAYFMFVLAINYSELKDRMDRIDKDSESGEYKC